MDDDDVYRHRGPARVFVSEHDAIAAIKGTDGRAIKPNDVIVLIGAGPLGTGMEETYQVTSALKYVPWGKTVALVTDGRFSGVSTGACIGHVGPEALAGGPIGKVMDGDVIDIVDRSAGSDGTRESGCGRRTRARGRRGSSTAGRSSRPIRGFARMPICRTTRGSGRRCRRRAADRGRAASTMSTGSSRSSTPVFWRSIAGRERLPGVMRASRARETLWALAIGVAALALYLLTLQPDFGGPEDTPKFQFLGYVLGTAHPPGYPLYVLLSHLFVKLPIRTIAYRANLFSAVMAAVACVIAYAIARQMGAARWAAGCAALGLATGASFWRSGVIAEVYSLAAVMVALTIVLLLTWSARGGSVYLLAAVAAFSAGLGNHLTIVGLIPAAIVFVLWRDRRCRGRDEDDVAQPFRAARRPLAGLKACATEAAGIVRFRASGRRRSGPSWFSGFRSTASSSCERTREPRISRAARSLVGAVRVVTAQRFAKQRFALQSAHRTDRASASRSVRHRARARCLWSRVPGRRPGRNRRAAGRRGNPGGRRRARHAGDGRATCPAT